MCGWRWRGTYQLPGNQNTVAACLGNYVGGGVPTRQPRFGHKQGTRTLVSRLDHCMGGGVPTNSLATKTLAVRLDHCVDGDGGVPTKSQATKTLWQHALATMWVEGVYLPNATDTPARTPKLRQNVVMRCIAMQELFSATISSLHNNSIHPPEIDINSRKTD